MASASTTNRGMRLGRFVILGHLASGGMSAVYRARDEETNREVAIKVLPPEFAEHPVRLKRFFREARAAAKLNHDNIVAIVDYGFANAVYYIAMELVDGPDLHSHVAARGPLPGHEALDILIQATRALSHAYFQGIVHRDVKPSNLLLGPTDTETRRHGQEEGRGDAETRGHGEENPSVAASPRPRVAASYPHRVKLTDFGLALDWTSLDESRLTRQGTTLGTVDYMAPEQARGSQLVDTRSDLYALGCTAYFMLTGRPPFPDGEVPDKLYKHVYATPADPRDFNPRIPDRLITILGKLLQKRPEDRYQTPAELLVDLERLKESLTPRPATPAVPTGKPGAAGSEAGRKSTPLENRSPIVTPKPPPPIPDVQPGWSVVAEFVTEALVYLSNPWVIAAGVALLALFIVFLIFRAFA